MSDDFLVQPESLRQDADTWDKWKTSLVGISDSVPRLGEGLDPLAFSILPGGPDVANAYGQVSSALTRSIAEGVTQFTEFSDKLIAVADRYETAEQANLDDIAATRAELEDI